MFYTLMIIALFGYALQSSLLVHHARKLNGFQVSMYRGVSLCISMTPLLFFVQLSDFQLFFTFQTILLLILAGITGYLGNSMSMQSLKYLPVGLNEALGATGKALLFVVLGLLLYKEILSFEQYALISVLVFSAILLGRQKHTDTTSIDVQLPQGLFFLSLSIFFSATTITVMSYLAKNTNPFLTGYFWEVFIAFSGLTVIRLTHKKFPKISWSQFGKIFLSSSPTLIGTGCAVYALSFGPLSIGGAILTGSIFVSSLLAWFLYDEKLSSKHWFFIVLIIGSLVGLKLME